MALGCLENVSTGRAVKKKQIHSTIQKWLYNNTEEQVDKHYKPDLNRISIKDRWCESYPCRSFYGGQLNRVILRLQASMLHNH